MADTARITITLPLPLKHALAKRAQQTGSSQSQLVIQAIEGLLSTEAPTLLSLQARVEQLEVQMGSLLSSAQQAVIPGSAAVVEHPLPPRVDLNPKPVLLPSMETEPPGDPNLWDPVEYSFDDWLFQIWRRVSTDQTGLPLPWGHSLAVETVHQMAFYELRFRRFIDRLLASEAPGLLLFPDETSALGLGDCRPGAFTFEETEVTDSNSTPNPQGNGSQRAHPLPPLEPGDERSQ